MSMEGKQIPQATFRSKNRSINLLDIPSSKVFDGKKVILFALPGAYTPTCTMEQLPRYEQLARLFKDNGIDKIVCVSVNDPFVMEKWGEYLGIREVELLSDGNGEFTKKMGMAIDLSGASLGTRSRRYSMYVENGEIKKMFIENPDAPIDMNVSDADTMYKYLYPNKAELPNISLIVQVGCPDCAKMKLLLNGANLPFEEMRYGYEVKGVGLKALANNKVFPQIFIDGKHIDSSIYMDGRTLKATPEILAKILEAGKK